MSDDVLLKFRRLIPDLEIDKIDVAGENVRKTEVKVNLEGLKTSVNDLGLIQPVIVIESNKRFELIVGQRRLLAFRENGQTRIPALVVGDLNTDDRRLVSFAENSLRRELPYDDTVALCSSLFDKLAGDKVSKIAKIAGELNIHPGTVLRYLSYQLVPKPVRILVDSGKLTRVEAYKIASAFWPNESKILEMARESIKLTKGERDQALRLGLKDPERSLTEIIDDAKKAGELVRVRFFTDKETYDALRLRAAHRKLDVASLLAEIVDEWLGRDVD